VSAGSLNPRGVPKGSCGRAGKAPSKISKKIKKMLDKSNNL
jgi:hypothetical protein